MVGILIVAHSARLVAGIKEFIDQAVGGRVPIAAVGGTGERSLGINAEQIAPFLGQLGSITEGVLVLVDFQSTVMHVELAREMLNNPPRILISNAPLVEGAYFAAVEASVGASLEEIAQAALRARDLLKVYQ
jgi:dihydroxyacetone kinase phosphotransfer subunit